MAELIITEKPASAKRIAEALADGKIVKESKSGVNAYRLTHCGKQITVGSSVGHVYGLKEKSKNGWSYPVFDVEWQPLHEVNKESAFTKKYLNVLKGLVKEADTFTIACDYDVEGEVIGLNIIRFVAKKKDARRMKFSTLTKPDLVEAYENASPHLDWGQARAGETRHKLDWFYGINLSRALTSAIKTTGMFKILSSGRVQGPALKIIVEKEQKILAFKPLPFWQLELDGSVKAGKIIAWHEADKFWKKEEAESVVKKVKGRDGKISDIKKTQQSQAPPFPFDLTTLQTEAFRSMGISPKNTLSIAQDLYTSGLISYPRTSSQKLSLKLGFENIIKELGKQGEYKVLCEKLLKKSSLKPNEGAKTDPAHPAIYPTGILPKGLKEYNKKIYDLIVRRFLATFAEPAVRETVSARVDVNNEIFVCSGTRTVSQGWFEFYGPHVKLREEELPKMEMSEAVKVEKIKLHAKETQPPKRYTPASIIRELEKKDLGTKATRAQIVDTLFERGYVEGTSIKATELGLKTIETLEKYSPEIIDEELTRHFELEMEQIREDKKKEEEVLGEAEEILKKILAEFKKKERIIGKELAGANRETIEKANTVGKCPNCENGTLMMRRGKFGRYIACSNQDCKTTFSLPSTGFAKVSEQVCKDCSHPMITMIRKGKKPQTVCINKECPSKQVDEKEIIEKPCPKCKEGKMVLRKSVYGSFLGCSNYPKCRNIEKINNKNSNEKSN